MTAVGFVVAGGRSSRMGRDKALLPWGGGTLLDHAAARLREACCEVRVLCGPDPRYAGCGLPLDVDVVREAGALGGLLTGLRVLRTGHRPGLFLAVDVPLVPAALLRHLIASSEGWDAVVPRTPAGPEPLCAVYRSACLPAVERRIAVADLKMTSFWSDVAVREIPEGDLARFGDPARMFRNLNSPDDYAALTEPPVRAR